MPFDAVLPELLLFLGLLTVLASLPTDPHFHPWHIGHPPYGMSRDPYRPSFLGGGDSGNESRVFSGFGHSSRDPVYLPYDVSSRSGWYPLEQRSGGPNDGGSISRRRSSEALAGGDYLGAQSIGNSYSSHVNYEAENRKKDAARKTPKTLRGNLEPVFRSGVPGKVDEVINRESNSGNSKMGYSRDLDVLNPRIVTPAGGRRSPQGNSGKNQSKPLILGATNTTSTTVRIFRNQTTTKTSKKPRPNNSKPQGGGIVFPDGQPKKFVPRLSKCSNKSTFCENLGEEYPSEYINQILKKEGATFREFFGKDAISDPDVAVRINGPEENSLCPYRQEIIFPKAAQNKEDKWLFIVNQDQYVQGVAVEVCLNPDSRCILTESFPLGYTTYCKQKYIERRLVALGEDGKPKSDSFWLPSCCSCVVKHEPFSTMNLRSSRDISGNPQH